MDLEKKIWRISKTVEKRAAAKTYAAKIPLKTTNTVSPYFYPARIAPLIPCPKHNQDKTVRLKMKKKKYL